MFENYFICPGESESTTRSKFNGIKQEIIQNNAELSPVKRRFLLSYIENALVAFEQKVKAPLQLLEVHNAILTSLSNSDLVFINTLLSAAAMPIVSRFIDPKNILLSEAQSKKAQMLHVSSAFIRGMSFALSLQQLLRCKKSGTYFSIALLLTGLFSEHLCEIRQINRFAKFFTREKQVETIELACAPSASNSP